MGAKWQIVDDSYLRLLEEADARELHELIEANRAIDHEAVLGAPGGRLLDVVSRVHPDIPKAAP